MLFRFAARGEALVATMQTLLRRPGVRDDRRGRAALAAPAVRADERMMAIVPVAQLDEDPAGVALPVFGDAAPRAAAPLESARMGPETDEPPSCAAAVAKLTGIPGDISRASSYCARGRIKLTMPAAERLGIGFVAVSTRCDTRNSRELSTFDRACTATGDTARRSTGRES